MKICGRMVEGWSLRRICREMPGAPHLSTVCGWLADPGHPFSEQYARASALRAELQADEIVEIADGLLSGDGEDCSERVQRDRLGVDARKWVAARMRPKRWGNKVDVGFGDAPDGAEGGNMEVTLNIVRTSKGEGE
jgi:hypothetical protein